MIAIAIDDEPIALDIVALHAGKVPFIKLTARFTNAFEAIDFLRSNQVDLIFLDIKMPDITGIDFLKALTKPPLVVFTTAYSEHAVQSFELDAVDYLLKPFSLSRFLKACNKAKELFDLRNQTPAQRSDFIFIKDGYEQVKVVLADILFVEASGNYTQIHLVEDKLISSRITINDLAAILPSDSFIRVHRTFIVAKGSITRFDRSQLWIADRNIPIGSTYLQQLKSL